MRPRRNGFLSLRPQDNMGQPVGRLSRPATAPCCITLSAPLVQVGVQVLRVELRAGLFKQEKSAGLLQNGLSGAARKCT